MNESWEKQLSRRVVLSHTDPEYFIGWVVENIPTRFWLTPAVIENAPEYVYSELSCRKGEMAISYE